MTITQENIYKNTPIHSHDSIDYVLKNHDFVKAPGSSDKHHNWTGGLLQHTFEVINIAVNMAATIPCDTGVLITAALWHDFGKTWAYEFNKDYGWYDTDKKSKFGGHLSSSFAEYWSFNRKKQYDLVYSPQDFVDHVLHCILSHHGCREWGSPARPQTNEAWILHLADSASARCLGGEKLS